MSRNFYRLATSLSNVDAELPRRANDSYLKYVQRMQDAF